MMAFNHGQSFSSSFYAKKQKLKLQEGYCILPVRLTKTKKLDDTTLWDNEHCHSLLVGV